MLRWTSKSSVYEVIETTLAEWSGSVSLRNRTDLPPSAHSIRTLEGISITSTIGDSCALESGNLGAKWGELVGFKPGVVVCDDISVVQSLEEANLIYTGSVGVLVLLCSHEPHEESSPDTSETVRQQFSSPQNSLVQ